MKRIDKHSLEGQLGPNEEFHWATLKDIDPAETGVLVAELETFYPAGIQTLSADRLDSSDTIYSIQRSDYALVVVDALHHTSEKETERILKGLLSDCPKTRFLILSDHNVNLPGHYGSGKKLRCSRNGKVLPYVPLHHCKPMDPCFQLKDLIVSDANQLKIQELLSFIHAKDFLSEKWGFAEKHGRGNAVTALFYGDSGTGKTMAAQAIASELGLPLYRVDLATIFSKWVGETEKNLRLLFDSARNQNAILFFDEGDVLFSSRSDVKQSQDRYANLSVNYLLQEIEEFDGVCLLSTNLTKNIDAAFVRRWTVAIGFSRPNANQRTAIWKANIPQKLPLAKDVDLEHLAQFDITGGNIKNCVRMAASLAASSKKKSVQQVDFLWAIKRELQKYKRELSREIVGKKYWTQVAPEWEFKLHGQKNTQKSKVKRQGAQL